MGVLIIYLILVMLNMSKIWKEHIRSNTCTNIWYKVLTNSGMQKYVDPCLGHQSNETVANAAVLLFSIYVIWKSK